MAEVSAAPGVRNLRGRRETKSSGCSQCCTGTSARVFPAGSVTVLGSLFGLTLETGLIIGGLIGRFTKLCQDPMLGRAGFFTASF